LLLRAVFRWSKTTGGKKLPLFVSKSNFTQCIFHPKPDLKIKKALATASRTPSNSGAFKAKKNLPSKSEGGRSFRKSRPRRGAAQQEDENHSLCYLDRRERSQAKHWIR
jgi:hypothetical protein